MSYRVSNLRACACVVARSAVIGILYNISTDVAQIGSYIARFHAVLIVFGGYFELFFNRFFVRGNGVSEVGYHLTVICNGDSRSAVGRNGDCQLSYYKAAAYGKGCGVEVLLLGQADGNVVSARVYGSGRRAVISVSKSRFEGSYFIRQTGNVAVIYSDKIRVVRYGIAAVSCVRNTGIGQSYRRPADGKGFPHTAVHIRYAGYVVVGAERIRNRTGVIRTCVQRLNGGFPVDVAVCLESHAFRGVAECGISERNRGKVICFTLIGISFRRVEVKLHGRIALGHLESGSVVLHIVVIDTRCRTGSVNCGNDRSGGIAACNKVRFRIGIGAAEIGYRIVADAVNVQKTCIRRRSHDRRAAVYEIIYRRKIYCKPGFIHDKRRAVFKVNYLVVVYTRAGKPFILYRIFSRREIEGEHAAASQHGSDKPLSRGRGSVTGLNIHIHGDVVA